MLDDRTVIIDLLNAAKLDVTSCARALNEASNGDLRDVLSQQLQQAQKAHEGIFAYAKNKGFYDPYIPLEQMVSEDFVMPRQLMAQK